MFKVIDVSAMQIQKFIIVNVESKVCKAFALFNDILDGRVQDTSRDQIFMIGLKTLFKMRI